MESEQLLEDVVSTVTKFIGLPIESKKVSGKTSTWISIQIYYDASKLLKLQEKKREELKQKLYSMTPSCEQDKWDMAVRKVETIL